MRTVSQRPVNNRNVRPEPPRPGEVVAYLLKSLHHSLRQAVDETFRARSIDMSFAHLAMLYSLHEQPGVAGAELARRGFVTAQTMNALLHRLEKDGDIERRPHPASLRADSWFITPAGEEKLERAKVAGGEVWQRMLSTFKAGEVAQLRDLLERCITGLDAQVEDMRAGKTAKRAAVVKRFARKVAAAGVAPSLTLPRRRRG
jgi:DNA-binding MarR family transcriptional regulator